MHRVLANDGTPVESTTLRIVRSIAYTLMLAAGALLIASDLVGHVYGLLGIVMAWFLVVGGGLSAVGAASRLWYGEFTGLPLLAPAFAVFGVLSWRVSNEGTPLIAAANLSLLVAIALVMVARWRVVFAVFRLADHLAGKDQRRE